MHLDAPSLQLLRDDAGGAHFLEADLGMGMQIASDGGEFFGIAVDAVDGGHVCYPVTGDVERDGRMG